MRITAILSVLFYGGETWSLRAEDANRLSVFDHRSIARVRWEHQTGAVSSRTGFALLLSGGTFLYVAASHILPELIHAQTGPHSHPTQSAQSGSSALWSAAPGMESSKGEDYTMYNVGAPENHVIYSASSKNSTEHQRLRPIELVTSDTEANFNVDFRELLSSSPELNVIRSLFCLFKREGSVLTFSLDLKATQCGT
ncbi:unnamed protein product [Echinostoma caproni]|uniref:Semaphorin-4B-like n=1 Tax=Echinostoma caproni TaxID=27848 RepID=A0A183AV03_9TREM|nr:unnamed protein product [Echinostoma caproni]